MGTVSPPLWSELVVCNTSDSEYPKFELTPTSSETKTSNFLPLSDLRYRKSQFQPGTRIEINSAAIRLIHSMTSFLVNGSGQNISSRGKGTALIIDYGPLDGIPSHSLRGVSGHKFTSPFDDPGRQDLTTDVDFGCMKDIALGISGARVSGPVSQGDWLMSMGLPLRADRLVKSTVTEESKEGVRKALQRLAGKGEGEMGGVYNVMAITSRETACEGFGGISSSSSKNDL
jgi:NADH dehydrogenase [ubiquinone] 1 alpha subcomplex assembly factor 7